MKLLLNYAHNSHYEAQKENSASGCKVGFDGVMPTNLGHLFPEFVDKHTRIFMEQRGAGYWLWKPYLILRHLKLLSEGDYLFYSDSGATFIHSIDPLIELGQDITLFHTDPIPENKELLQTKLLTRKMNLSSLPATLITQIC